MDQYSASTNSTWILKNYKSLDTWILSSNELWFSLFMAILITVAKLEVKKTVKQILKKSLGKKSENISSRFEESFWQAIWYSTSFCFDVYITYSLNLFPTVENCWKDWPQKNLNG